MRSNSGATGAGAGAPITTPIDDLNADERRFAGFGFRTLLETGGVPVWEFIEAANRQDGGQAEFSPLVRAVSAGLSLEEGERRLFWERYSADNPLSGGGRVQSVNTWDSLVSLGDNCADLVVCDASSMHRDTVAFVPGLGRLDTQDTLDLDTGSMSDSQAADQDGRIDHQQLKRNETLRALGHHYLRNVGNVSNVMWPDSTSLSTLFVELDRLTDDGGICVLIYSHSASEAWFAFAQALTTSVWRCWATVPWALPMMRDPQHPYSPYSHNPNNSKDSNGPYEHRYGSLREPRDQAPVEWTALMVCRRRLATGSSRLAKANAPTARRTSPLAPSSPTVPAPSMPSLSSLSSLALLVDRTSLIRVNEKLRSYVSLLRYGGNVELSLPDVTNLWQAMMAAEAFRGAEMPNRLALSDALQTSSQWLFPYSEYL